MGTSLISTIPIFPKILAAHVQYFTTVPLCHKELISGKDRALMLGRKMDMVQSREGNDETEIAETAVAAAPAGEKVLLIKYLFTSMQK